MKSERNAYGMLLICFVLAGGWAGSVASYTLYDRTQPTQTAEHKLDGIETGIFFNRGEKQEKRTQPYTDPSTPKFETPPVPEGLEFPAPAGPEPTIEDIIGDKPPVVVAPPVVETPEKQGDSNPISSALGSLTKLFNGEADFSDIINLAVAAFTIFGGAQLGGSDILFKTVLGLFSKKTNFYAILKENVDLDTNRRLLRKLKK